MKSGKKTQLLLVVFVICVAAYFIVPKGKLMRPKRNGVKVK